MVAIGLVLAGGEMKAGDMKDKEMMGKTHKMKAEIVSVDVEGKMMVIKDEKGEEHKAPVMGKAVDTLKMWKAGDKVTVVCQDNEKDEHQGIVEIMKIKAEHAAAQK
jgi:hypothetical protein